METILVLNGYEIVTEVDYQEQIILELAAGEITRENFTEWLNKHIVHIIG